MPGNNLLQPCQCRDPIHEQCLLEWVERRMESIDESRKLKCEICKNAYKVVFEPYECFTCEIAKPKYSQFRGEFAKYLMAFLVLVVLFSLLVTLMFKLFTEVEFCGYLESLLALPKNTIVAIIVTALIFVGVLAIGVGYRLVRHFCYGVRWRLAEGRPA